MSTWPAVKGSESANVLKAVSMFFEGDDMRGESQNRKVNAYL